MEFATPPIGNSSRTQLSYVYHVEDRMATLLLPCGRDDSITTTDLKLPEPGKFFDIKLSKEEKILSAVEATDIGSFVGKEEQAFSHEQFQRRILPAVMLARRVRHFEETCCVVISLEPFTFSMPANRNFLKTLQLKTLTGHTFTVPIDKVNRQMSDRTQRVFCPGAAVPASLKVGDRLRIVTKGEAAQTPAVLAALMPFYEGKTPIARWDLIDRIWGEPNSAVFSQPSDNTLVTVRRKSGVDLTLNASQSAAVRLYNTPNLIGSVVESPPGSGKTLTAAAMVATFEGKGTQLLLSAPNEPVDNIERVLSALDCNRTIRRLESAQRAMQAPSLFSALPKLNEEEGENMKTSVEELTRRERRRVQMQMKKDIMKAIATSFNSDSPPDVILSTIDTLFIQLQAKKGCKVLQQHLSSVRRIIVEEASQVSALELLALHARFPHAAICLIGDSKQLPPYMYQEGELLSELAARSAISVFRQRNNLQVIKLTAVYRVAQADLMMHYSELFYDGRLLTGKPDSLLSVSLKCISPNITRNCLFMTVPGGVTKHVGTSLVNKAEVAALQHVLALLRADGHEPGQVMVIAFYEAQRKAAQKLLGAEYDVLTVDSAQGKERDIVILLTTRTSPGEFVNCPLRCNVAVSRHRQALIILGHDSLRQAEPWRRLLSTRYFDHLEYGA